jgi:hypothetical protein
MLDAVTVVADICWQSSTVSHLLSKNALEISTSATLFSLSDLVRKCVGSTRSPSPANPGNERGARSPVVHGLSAIDLQPYDALEPLAPTALARRPIVVDTENLDSLLHCSLLRVIFHARTSSYISGFCQ